MVYTFAVLASVKQIEHLCGNVPIYIPLHVVCKKYQTTIDWGQS